ncbi:hypothetical protein AB1L30_05140 [Bremerella sp. JC817]|uniref:hypothetical protein n=1 Tax=Bremerella sp. JC817 TaxID=3231756 RepID=UPI003457F354
MPNLPDCDDLFQRFFAPWYSEVDLASRGFEATRPDLLCYGDHIGRPAAELSRLHPDAQAGVIQHLSVAMTDAAIGDFGKLVGLEPPLSGRWIQAIDQYYDEQHIAELIAESDPTDDANSYLITCIELGTLIAKMLQAMVPDLEWWAESPYWESSLWHPATGHMIPPTHWAIKKFSGYGWDDGLAPKIFAAVQALREDTHDNEDKTG